MDPNSNVNYCRKIGPISKDIYIEIILKKLLYNRYKKSLTLRIRLSFEMPHSFGECVLFRLRSNGEPPTNLDRWNINNSLQNLARIYLNTYAFMHETQCNYSNSNCKTGNIQLDFWQTRPTKKSLQSYNFKTSKDISLVFVYLLPWKHFGLILYDK